MSEQEQRLIQVMLNQVEQGQYPSPTMMDRFEGNVRDPAAAKRYVDRLLDTLEQERYPSPMLLERVFSLVQALDPPEDQDGSSN